MRKIILNIVLLSVFVASLFLTISSAIDISKEVTVKLHEFDWSGVSGVMDMVMVILTFVLLVGLKQGSKSIEESTRSRNAELLNWAMEEMSALKPAIRLVTDAHKREPYSQVTSDVSVDYVSTWSKEELQAAQAVSVALQRMGYFATHDLVSKKHFLNLWGPLYLSCWYSLEGWVKHKRLQLDEPFDIADGAYSRLYFEKYAMYCEEKLPPLLLNNTRRQFGLEPMVQPKAHIKLGIKLKARLTEKVDI
ncbi:MULTISPECIES: hypothetical protein [Vibrio]|uniref:hypothetical protein n=1 Tax=Vibrio TaxID=662 RepID=UPI000808B5DD|nr:MULTISPECIES: hypothetical protein [Vibrio]MCT4347479.1 hypothetical protein [Vibrio sp. NC2]SBS64600.1 hypothetical protein VHE8714_02296 [Vibrio splendidus]